LRHTPYCSPPASRSARSCLAVLAAASLLAACARVRVEGPREPIVVNLNVKVEQEVRVKIDPEVEALIDNEELFGEEAEDGAKAQAEAN
jgi:hypothetical protein